MKNSKSSVTPSIGILIIKGNKVLLVKHKAAAKHLTGSYGLPSGRLEKGESEIDAAVRELKEETGLQTKKENLFEFPNNFYFQTVERKGGKFERFSWKVFRCIEYEGKIKESTETIPQWIEISTLDSLKLLLNIENAVRAGVECVKYLSS